MRDKYIQTAESVTEGHPDKLCDTIADTVLDACLRSDPAARVACEVLATAGKILVAGEITAAELPDIPALICRTVREAGYGGSNYEVEVITHDQSAISPGLFPKRSRPELETRVSCTATPAARRTSFSPCLLCWPTA